MITITRPETLPETRLKSFTAYEYEDFASFDTLVKYGLDTTERITRRGRLDLLADFMTVDIETTTISAGIEYNQSEYPYAVPYLYQVYIFGRVIFFRFDWQFRHFVEWLDETLADAGVAIAAYDHNLSFEYQFFKSRIPLNFDTVFALQSRRIGRADTARGGIEFRCSYLLSNMSLEKFTENYCTEEFRKDKEIIDYEVIRWPWSDLENEIYYYSGMDVITLYHAVNTLMQREHDNLKSIPMTNTGYVRRACRSACLGDNWRHYRNDEEKETYTKFKNYRRMILKCAPDYEQYKMLRDAFRGGNTHANRFKAGMIIDNVGSFDFASSYPAALVCYDGFPMGRLMDCTNSINTPDDLTRYCNRYWVCVTVLFRNIKLRDPYNTLCPYISLSKCQREWEVDENGIRKPRTGYYDNGRLLSQEGYVKLTFLGCEWDIIRRQYTGEMKVIKAIYTVRGELPKALRAQCYEWYKAKTELKNVAGMEYEYMKSKNRVNSIYGMMVEQIVKMIMEINKENGDIEQRVPTDEEATAQIEEWLNPRNRKYLLYQWGVTITAICRVRHMEIIGIFGRDFVYGDTDSVKTEYPEKYADVVAAYNEKWISYASQFDLPIDAYTKKGERQILGFLDYEKDHFASKFVTLGAKKYAQTDSDGRLYITVAGVPKKIGARILGRIENFRPGFNFTVSDGAALEDRQNWKKLLTYRDDLNEDITIDGHEIHLSSCIAMERTTYQLEISDEYEILTGYHDRYTEIYEEDPEIWD